MSAARREVVKARQVKDEGGPDENDDDDEKKPWSVVIKPERKPDGGAPAARWRDTGRASTFAPSSKDEETRTPLVVPVHKDDAKPWDETRAKPVTERPLPPPKPAETKKQESPVVIMLPPTSEGGAWRERVCAQNYAAMDAESGAYGLIAGGLGEAADPGGVRSLVMHVPRKVQHRAGGAHRVLTQVRPGSILRVQRAASKRARDDEPAPPVRELRVRFTTPARYYGPGSKVTTLAIGVDEADWQDVVLAQP